MEERDCCIGKKCNNKSIIINQQSPVPPSLHSLFQLGLKDSLTISVLANNSISILIPFVFNLSPIRSYLLGGVSPSDNGVSLPDGYWNISSNLSLSFPPFYEPLNPFPIVITSAIVLNPNGLNETLIEKTYNVTPYAIGTNGFSLFFVLTSNILQLNSEVIRLISGSPKDIAVRLTIRNNIRPNGSNLDLKSSDIDITVEPRESLFKGNMLANL